MRFFVKYFTVSLVIQMVLLTLWTLTAVGEFIVAFLYLIPLEILSLAIDFSKLGDGKMTFFCLLSIPAVFYSLLFSVLMLPIRRLWKPNVGHRGRDVR